ncbi:MAG: radical SAM protein [Desulfobacteraceae bacterium]|jgi:spore photoproduct lyase
MEKQKTVKFKINKIIMEEGAENYSLSEKITERLGNLPSFNLKHGEDSLIKNDLDMDKETLRLLAFKGEFLKPCPGTNNYICCGYQILNMGTNCPLDCSYCILQAYFNKPSLRLFVNLEAELARIGKLIDNSPEKLFRIGTGEFTDSLALDDIHQFSNLLAEFIAEKKNSVIEYKTKTTEINRLFDIQTRERIIISWSLNSPYIVTHEEHKAPSIEQRLIAAKRCQEEGFVTGFHFDPLILHENWQDQYKKTIDLMDKYLNPAKIIWLSMGCIRFVPALKPIILKRHPETLILNGEFIQGLDGKFRYFKPVRIKFYRFLRKHLGNWAGFNPGIYMCMESDEIWRKSIGWSPVNSEGLSDYLDSRVRLFW